MQVYLVIPAFIRQLGMKLGNRGKIHKRIIDHSSLWTCISYISIPPAKFMAVLLAYRK